PVADVLLDFQSVMAQFLELQTEVFSALVRRKPRVHSSGPAAMASPIEPAAPVAAVEVSPAASSDPQARSDEASVWAAATASEAVFSRYTLAVRDRPAGGARGTLAAAHAVVVTDEGRGVTEQVAERLRREGHRVAVVSSRAFDVPDLFVSPLDSVEE